jgi:serine-type D-Ala-D-Ala carboxypeptidase (penicillin-binding protein 5/6)
MTDYNEHNPIIPTSEEENPPAIPVTPQLLLLGGLLLVLLGGGITSTVVSYLQKPEPIEIPTSETEVLPIRPYSSVEQANAFSDIRITGKAAYVWDISTQQVLFAKNEGNELPIASITKLMTALVAHELLEETEPVAVTTEATRQDSASGLQVGQTFSSQALSDLILLSSSNDGAYALAATAGAVLQPNNAPNAFVAAMNVRAEEIGLTQTRFLNPTGLDISPSEAGAYSTARDIAFLMEYIIRNEPDILRLTQSEEAVITDSSGATIQAQNTNYSIDQIPGLLGSKTGYTDLAGGNLVVAYDAGLNRPVIVVVLGSTIFERFTDVNRLIAATAELMQTN